MSSNRYFFAILVWVCGAFFIFFKNLIEVSPGVITQELMSSFHIDGMLLGNLAAFYFYAYVLMQIPAGLLLDKFGPRRVTSVAILICGFGLLLFSMAPNLTIAYIGRFLTGIGAAFAVVNCFKLISNWFAPVHFALMSGLMMTIGMAGAIFGQHPLSILVEHVGWRETFQILFIASVILLFFFFMIVRDSPTHHHAPPVMAAKQSSWKIVGTIIRSKQAWVLSLYSGLAFTPVSVFGGLWGVPFLQLSHALTRTEAAHAVSYIFLGFAVGAPLWGWISDKTRSRKYPMWIGTWIALAALCMVLYASSIHFVILCSMTFLFGFSIAAFLLCFTMIREITPLIFAATAVGFMNGFDAALGAVTDPLTGWILDLFWDGKIVDGARYFDIDTFRISLSMLPIYIALAICLLPWVQESFPQKDSE